MLKPGRSTKPSQFTKGRRQALAQRRPLRERETAKKSGRAEPEHRPATRNDGDKAERSAQAETDRSHDEEMIHRIFAIASWIQPAAREGASGVGSGQEEASAGVQEESRDGDQRPHPPVQETRFAESQRGAHDHGHQ